MSQISFSPPPTVKVLCNLCSVDAGPFPSPMQAAAAVLDLGWFNHGVKVSICPVCLAYYRMVFQNPSLPGLAETLQSQAENVVEMPSRNLMVLEQLATVPSWHGRAVVLRLLSLLRVGDPVFLLCAWNAPMEGLGIGGNVEIQFAALKDGGILTLRVHFGKDPDLVEFTLGPNDGILRTERGMCYTLAGVPGSVFERSQPNEN